MTLEQEILIKEARARREGSIETLVELAADGKIPMDEGAKRADMTIKDFQDAVKKKQNELK